jgi:hypothetical protein
MCINVSSECLVLPQGPPGTGKVCVSGCYAVGSICTVGTNAIAIVTIIVADWFDRILLNKDHKVCRNLQYPKGTHMSSD